MTEQQFIPYDQLASLEQGGFDLPYICEVNRDDQQLVFFGSEHTADPTHPQFDILQTRWQDFVGKAPEMPMVLIEGSSDVLSRQPETRDQAIAEGAEPELMVYFAQNDGVAIDSAEPRDIDLATQLAAEFEKDEVMLFHVISYLAFWNQPPVRGDIDESLGKLVDYLAAKFGWQEQGYSPQQIRNLYRQAVNEELNTHDGRALGDLVTPFSDKTVINKIARRSGDLRDAHLLTKIRNLWQNGHSLFVVFGAAHAVRLEQSLRELA